MHVSQTVILQNIFLLLDCMVARVKFDYEGTYEGEMTIKEGETLHVIDQK